MHFLGARRQNIYDALLASHACTVGLYIELYRSGDYKNWRLALSLETPFTEGFTSFISDALPNILKNVNVNTHIRQ